MATPMFDVATVEMMLFLSFCLLQRVLGNSIFSWKNLLIVNLLRCQW